jgi:hypothetical protein
LAVHPLITPQYVSGVCDQALESAKKLSEDLLGTVREDFEEHKKNFAARASGPPMGGYGGGYPPRVAYPPMGAPGYLLSSPLAPSRFRSS